MVAVNHQYEPQAIRILSTLHYRPTFSGPTIASVWSYSVVYIVLKHIRTRDSIHFSAKIADLDAGMCLISTRYL